MEINNSLKKCFCNDFKLPINIFSEPYFSYYLELYNDLFDIKEKLNFFEETLAKLKEPEDFFKQSNEIILNVKNLILNTKAYQDFNNADVNKLFPLEENIKQQNIYIPSNINKKLISIDLQKANFNCLDLFDLKKEINANTYEELLSKFTSENYYLKSKKIRQVIFGDLNPARQQRLQKYIISVFCNQLKKAGCILSSASSDEIIVQNEEMTPEKIKNILSNIPEKFNFYPLQRKTSSFRSGM